LSQLRYELTTDKPFKQFEDKGQDVDLWNSHLEKLKATIGEENCSWFKAPWLFSECYMYRRQAGLKFILNFNKIIKTMLLLRFFATFE
jgi:hypothetical protein